MKVPKQDFRHPSTSRACRACHFGWAGATLLDVPWMLSHLISGIHMKDLSILSTSAIFTVFLQIYRCNTAATLRQENEFYGHGLVDAGACRLESIRADHGISMRF